MLPGALGLPGAGSICATLDERLLDTIAAGGGTGNGVVDGEEVTIPVPYTGGCDGDPVPFCHGD